MPADTGQPSHPSNPKTPAGTAGTSIATDRTPGLDVARAIAFLGMVLVNYKGKLEASSRGPDWLVWLSDRVDGRAAALFVVLAGVGVSLRSRRARDNPSEYLTFERVALLKRAAVLFIAGLLHLHMWDWDILHCYGLFLVAAALLLHVRGPLLWVLALACMAVASVLQTNFDYHYDWDFWTLEGAASKLFFSGSHPFFPWMAFLLFGMWAGRLDWNDDDTRRRLLRVALAVLLAGECIDTLGERGQEFLGLSDESADWLSSWPVPPRPVYVFTATATAFSVICLCIQVTRSRSNALWVVALTATGQLAFTLYVLHGVAIVIPLQHGCFEHASLAESMAYGLLVFAMAVAVSLWWRRRFPFGPLESLIRQITGRTSPAPWGGRLVDSPKNLVDSPKN